MLHIARKQELFYQKHLKISDRINFIYHMSYTWKNKIIFVCTIVALALLTIIYFASNEYVCIVFILMILIFLYSYFLTDSIIITQNDIYIYKLIYNKVIVKIELNRVFEVELYKRTNHLAISLYDGTNKSYNVRLDKENFKLIENMIAIHKDEAKFDLEEELKKSNKKSNL